MQVLVSQRAYTRVQALRARQVGIDAIIVLEQVGLSPFTHLGTFEGPSLTDSSGLPPVSRPHREYCWQWHSCV